MQRLTILIFIFLLKQGCSFSQDSIIVLHPLIGEIIDNNEKSKYLLFEEIPDTLYNCAFIQYSNSFYYLNVFKTNTNDQYVKQIDSAQINQYYNNITKLNQYFTSLQNKDSIEISDIERRLSRMENCSMEILILDKSSMNKIIEEITVNDRIKDDAETKELNEKGFKNFSKFYYPGSK